MRKKIGKRIGPVPIALVAVLALAAFISAGLLLTVNGNVAQAQDVPSTPDGISAKKCQATVAGDDDDMTGVQNSVDATVSGGGCIVSGDSVDVEFRNFTDDDQYIAVYVTGGDDYSHVQAMDDDDAIGARGVGEDILTIDGKGTAIGGGEKAGSESITVNRDMAKNGEVYLFAYIAGDTPGAANNPSDPFHNTYKQFHIADDGDGANNDDIGIPLSILTGSKSNWPDNFEEAVYASANDEMATASTEYGQLMIAAGGTPGQEDATQSGLSVAITLADDLFGADVVTDDEMIAEEVAALDTARREIEKVKDDPNYGTDTVRGNDNTVTTQGTDGIDGIEDLVEDAEAAIAAAEAVLEAIEDNDPRHFFNETDADIVVKVVFRNTAAAAKLVAGEYTPADDVDGSMGSTLFVGRAGGEVNDMEAPDDLTATAETASVTVRIRDSRGVDLKGFVDLSIDTSAEGAADAVFEASARSTHYVELGVGDDNDDGETTAEIKGLPKNDALRIPVTASFNSGELELTSYIVRKGDAMMVEAGAYICDGDCEEEIAALNDKANKSDDPDPVIALGPANTFFISASSIDAVGNKIDSKGALSWKVTADTDNEEDAKTAISGPDDKGSTDEAITISEGDDAVPGIYYLTVTSSDGGASAMIMIIVSDDASMLTVACDPEIVPTRTGETLCTATVTDAAGNIPSNLISKDADDDDRHAVTITVRNKEAQHPDSANFNAMGNAMFSVLLGEDVEVGSEITINVTTTIGDETLRQSTVVTYGEMMVEMPEMPEAGMAMNLMATANDDGSIMLDWTAGMDANWHFLRGDEVGGDEAVVWTFTSASDSHMVPADMLTSGTEYSFIVIAGYFVKNDAGGWDGGWSAGWTTAAMATAMAGN